MATTTTNLQNRIDNLRDAGKISKYLYLRWTSELKSSDSNRLRMSMGSILEAADLAEYIPEGKFGYPQPMSEADVDRVMNELKLNVSEIR